MMEWLEKLTDEEKEKIYELLLSSKNELKGKQKPKPTIPHKNCDNCHNACITQSQDDLTELLPDCEHLQERYYVKETNRIHCPHWRRKVLTLVSEEDV